MCVVGQITDFRDRSQLSGVQSGTIVTGTFTLNGQSNLSGKIDLSSGSDDVPVWTLTSSISSGVGEGIWTVLDQGYIKFTGKLTTAKNLGLENKTYPGTLNVTFTPSDGNAVVYGGKLFFKVIEKNQVVGLAIPQPNADKLSDDFFTDPDELVSRTLTGSLVAYDQSKKATSDILNLLDPEDKVWSKNRKHEVTGDLGDIGLHLDSTFYHLKKAFEKATKFDGSSYPK